MTVTPSHALTAMHDFGVDVRPYSENWWTFTTAGGFNPVGIAHHHTGGSAALLTPGSLSQKAMHRMLRAGRPDLDGPLCHFAPTFNGVGKRAIVYAIGWGNCNHAGLIARNVADLLKAGKYTGQAPGPDAVDGNSILYGFEYLHPGDRTSWPDELLDAGHRAAAALCEAHGWDGANGPGSNAEHRELTTRKPDRSWSGWGDGMRAAVARLLVSSDDDTTPPDPQGWVRPEKLQDAIRALRAQADVFEERNQPRKAEFLRAEARVLAKRFPRIL